VWFAGTQSDQPVVRNTIAKVPHDIATLLVLANPSLYTIRSIASEGLLPPALQMVEAAGPR